MLNIQQYISEFEHFDDEWKNILPWDLCAQAAHVIRRLRQQLGAEYVIHGEVAVHRNTIVEDGAIIKGPAIIGKRCFVSAQSILREGIFLGEGVTIGPHCELKASFIFSHSTLAHFNYVGNSLIGSSVNLEAGAILANHFNERDDKEIAVCIEGRVQKTSVEKFGALVGDAAKIGANAVTTPGTILAKHSIVPRLTCVNQLEIPGTAVISVSSTGPLADTSSALPLRPHHLLDILRNYGHDRAFIPHPYGHALHTVAHCVLTDLETAIQLVLGADAICQPCQHLQIDHTCQDVLPQLAHPLSKQVYNDTLDLRVLAYLALSPGCVLTVRSFLEAVATRLPGLEMICTHPGESIEFRLRGLQQGLRKLGIRKERNCT